MMGGEPIRPFFAARKSFPSAGRRMIIALPAHVQRSVRLTRFDTGLLFSASWPKMEAMNEGLPVDREAA